MGIQTLITDCKRGARLAYRFEENIRMILVVFGRPHAREHFYQNPTQLLERLPH